MTLDEACVIRQKTYLEFVNAMVELSGRIKNGRNK